jgi:hypothetical protein
VKIDNTPNVTNLLQLNHTFKDWNYLGRVVCISDEGIHIAKRRAVGLKYEYYTELVPKTSLCRVELRWHVSISGILWGTFALLIGGAFAYFGIMGLYSSGKCGVIFIFGIIFFILFALGCRRRKAVFSTTNKQYKWISDTFSLPEAEQHTSAIESWCKRNSIEVIRVSSVAKKFFIG